MSTKHTPWPWVFGLSNRGNEAAIIGDGDTVVCFLPDASTGCTFKPADARLIASAPDLLEALETLDSLWSESAAQAVDFSHAIKQARAAIAKATGEQA